MFKMSAIVLAVHLVMTIPLCLHGQLTKRRPFHTAK